MTLFTTHTTHYVQNSAFEQSIANTWTNNKTYLQSLDQKHQIVRAKSELTQFFLIIFLFIIYLLFIIDIAFTASLVLS